MVARAKRLANTVGYATKFLCPLCNVKYSIASNCQWHAPGGYPQSILERRIAVSGEKSAGEMAEEDDLVRAAQGANPTNCLEPRPELKNS